MACILAHRWSSRDRRSRLRGQIAGGCAGCEQFRLHHRRRRLRGLHARLSPVRRSRHQGAGARSRRLGLRSLDSHPARLGPHPAEAAARLDVFRRAVRDAWTAGASNAPAARSSAARRRSTPWPTTTATAATTTAGPPTACRGWDYAHVLPYFRRAESWEGGADTYRGGDGPLTTQYYDVQGSDLRGLHGGRQERRPSVHRRTTTAPSRKASRRSR